MHKCIGNGRHSLVSTLRCSVIDYPLVLHDSRSRISDYKVIQISQLLSPWYTGRGKSKQDFSISMKTTTKILSEKCVSVFNKFLRIKDKEYTIKASVM